MIHDYRMGVVFARYCMPTANWFRICTNIFQTRCFLWKWPLACYQWISNGFVETMNPHILWCQSDLSENRLVANVRGDNETWRVAWLSVWHQGLYEYRSKYRGLFAKLFDWKYLRGFDFADHVYHYFYNRLEFYFFCYFLFCQILVLKNNFNHSTLIMSSKIYHYFRILLQKPYLYLTLDTLAGVVAFNHIKNDVLIPYWPDLRYFTLLYLHSVFTVWI